MHDVPIKYSRLKFCSSIQHFNINFLIYYSSILVNNKIWRTYLLLSDHSERFVKASYVYVNCLEHSSLIVLFPKIASKYFCSISAATSDFAARKSIKSNNKDLILNRAQSTVLKLTYLEKVCWLAVYLLRITRLNKYNNYKSAINVWDILSFG